MKRKTLFTMLVIVTMAISACGKAEETVNTNVDTSIVESSAVASSESVTEPATEVAESSAEVAASEALTSEEASAETETSAEVASGEAAAGEEAPAVAEMSYEVSAVMMADGSAWNTEKAPCLDYYETPDYEKPYYTVTNTSDFAYKFSINLYGYCSGFEGYYDNNFEPGETITLPALPCYAEDGTLFWGNVEEGHSHGVDVDISTSEIPADNTRNTIQEKVTVNYDASVAYKGKCSLPSLTFEYTRDFHVDYIVLYDEAGNAFNSNCVIMNYRQGSIIDNCVLEYMSAGESFSWASADIYCHYAVD